MKKERLRLETITTYDGEIKTLDHFNLNLYEGEVLGLFINSALEKSHFIDLIIGKQLLESGRICFENKPKDQIGLISQKLSLIQNTSKLINDLTISENIFVIREDFSGYFLQKGVLSQQGARIFSDLEIELDIDTPINRLKSSEKVIVEIVKSYALGKKIIILDNLSSFLSDDDLHEVFELVKKLQKQGISFIVIDSLVNILKEISNRLCIIKNGKNMWTLKQEEIDEEIIKSNFFTVKQTVTNQVTDTVKSIMDKKMIKFYQLDSDAFQPFDLTISPGEFVTVLDSKGTAIEALTKILTGERKPTGGRITIGEHPLKLHQSLRQGIAIIPETPVKNAMFKDMKAIDNLCFPANEKAALFWVRERFRENCKVEYGKHFEAWELDAYIDQLSIYSQQKIAYMRWHLYKPKLVVCIRPFSSIEIELRPLTRQLIEMLLESGIPVLALTSNLSEMNSSGTKIVITPK